jgi:hypothetical protein
VPRGAAVGSGHRDPGRQLPGTKASHRLPPVGRAGAGRHALPLPIRWSSHPHRSGPPPPPHRREGLDHYSERDSPAGSPQGGMEAPHHHPAASMGSPAADRRNEKAPCAANFSEVCPVALGPCLPGAGGGGGGHRGTTALFPERSIRGKAAAAAASRQEKDGTSDAERAGGRRLVCTARYATARCRIGPEASEHGWSNRGRI